MIAHGKTPAIDIQELYLGISSFTAARWMTPGELDLLCYIDPTDIIPYGIPYLKRKFSSFPGEMDAFWAYFEQTWVYGVYPVDLWNIYRFKDCFEQIQNRTNNGLERFNRTLNQLFDHQTPSLPVFVEKIKEISSQTLQNLDDIKNFRKQPHQREVMGYLVVEDAYYDFKDKQAQ